MGQLSKLSQNYPIVFQNCMVKKEQPILVALIDFINKHHLFCIETNDLNDFIT